MLPQVLAVLSFAGLVAFINERLIEVLVAKQISGTRYERFLDLVAFVTGTVGGFVLGIDFVTPLADSFGIEILYSWSANVISAMTIGGGSNILHDVVAWIQATKQNKQATAEYAENMVTESATMASVRQAAMDMA